MGGKCPPHAGPWSSSSPSPPSASFVGLGESIHTSGGYYRMKHRVFRYLVERMGFRALAFESPWDAADRVGAYVAGCGEAPEEALEGLFSVWQSAEVRDLVAWMCEWNRTHRRPRDKVHFFGFDIQQGWHDGPALVAFLERIGLADDDPRVRDVSRCDDVTTGFDNVPVREEDHQACVAALAGIEALFAEQESAIVRATSRADLAWARVRLVGLQAWEDEAYYLSRNDPRYFAARDAGMAYVLRAIRDLRYPGVRTAVWAHNVHLARNAPEFFFSETMGGYLRRGRPMSPGGLSAGAGETSSAATETSPAAAPTSSGAPGTSWSSDSTTRAQEDIRLCGPAEGQAGAGVSSVDTEVSALDTEVAAGDTGVSGLDTEVAAADTGVSAPDT